MNVVAIIPTGIGCEIGGHAGDATPSIKSLAEACDSIIVNPNAVNASDINEMPNNALYVEGYTLNRFLQGQIALEEVYLNRIMLAVNKPIMNSTVNSINAGRMTIGSDIKIMELDTELTLRGIFSPDGRATGIMTGHEEAAIQIHRTRQYSPFDVLAIQTIIEVDKETSLRYAKEKGVNPWGGAEAICSRFFSRELSVQCAHAPYESGVFGNFNEIVDARMAAEFVSVSYIHCILKGLHRAPKAVSYNTMSKDTIRIDDIDMMISPDGCWDIPHEACADWGIPIVFVRENKNIYKPFNKAPNNCIIVENYTEAAGVILNKRAGVTLNSTRRFKAI